MFVDLYMEVCSVMNVYMDATISVFPFEVVIQCAVLTRIKLAIISFCSDLNIS